MALSASPSCANLDWWDDLLQPYAKNRGIAVCPSQKTEQGCAADVNKWDRGGAAPIKWMSYSVNTLEDWAITGWTPNTKYGFRRPYAAGASMPRESVSEAEVQEPAGTIWLVDTTSGELWHESSTDYGTGPGNGLRRHSEGFNALFGDGHAKWQRFKSTKPSMWSIQQD